MKKSGACAEELSRMHGDKRFEACETMGEITFLNISTILDLADEAPARFLR